MQKSTFKLTKHELSIISDADFMRTKQLLIKNISSYFKQIGEQLLTKYYADSGLTHKITRGENYLDMPYVVLDVPQLKPNNISRKLRIMAWWGHYVSLQYFIDANAKNLKHAMQLPAQNYKILTSQNLFNNQLESADFAKPNQLHEQSFNNMQYTKIASIIPLTNLQNMEMDIENFMTELKKAYLL